MGRLCRRSRALGLVLAWLAVSLVARTAPAQTTVVVNPKTLTFTPSADQSAVLSDGRPAVDHYDFNVYSVGAAQPFQTTNIGKPAPASDGLIHYDFSAGISAWPLPGGNYEARVAAVGPMGNGTSAVSNPFTFSSCAFALSGTAASLPAAGGGTQVTVTTSTGCAWTAASNVSWVAISPTSGTGNGTVVATVAANTGTASRVGTLTVAGQGFTVNEAGTVISAPSTPASPSPAAGATAVGTTPTLTWTSSGATGYSIAFGTANPPPQAATGLGAASYAPGALSAGVTYYWRVTASNSGGSTTGPVWSFTTATATVPPSSTLPAPWRNQDIGTVGLAGSASASNGTFSVSGSGADIWGSADAFQYVSQAVSGNIQIVARMTGEQNTNQYAKAGVMLREALTANAAHVILDVLPSGEIEFMSRSAAGATTTHLAAATQAPPAWLKLTRVGGTVTGSVSADGTTWRTVGSTTVTMAASANVGLAVTSHDTSLRNTATFDSVAVTAPAASGVPAGWSSQDVGSVGLSGSMAYNGGVFTVVGSGADIWGTADAFRYAYQSLAGDGQIVARVTAVQNTNGYAKAGVMLRAGTAAGDAHIVLDLLPNGSVEFMKRSAAGAITSYLAGGTQAAPCWLRLARVGSTVTASISADGTTWRTVGSTTVGFGSAYVGLAVTSHDTTLRNTSTFDNVTVR